MGYLNAAPMGSPWGNRQCCLVCFDCRLTRKARYSATCPKCRKAMVNMGPNFKAPPKRDAKAWANRGRMRKRTPAVNDRRAARNLGSYR